MLHFRNLRVLAQAFGTMLDMRLDNWLQVLTHFYVDNRNSMSTAFT